MISGQRRPTETGGGPAGFLELEVFRGPFIWESGQAELCKPSSDWAKKNRCNPIRPLREPNGYTPFPCYIGPRCA